MKGDERVELLEEGADLLLLLNIVGHDQFGVEEIVRSNI